MKLPRSLSCSALALALACTLPAAAHAAVVYNQINVRDAHGVVLASLTATPAEIAANPFELFVLSGIAVDTNEIGNFGIVLENGNPFELFGIVSNGSGLAFGFEAVASQYPVQNPVNGTGAPIDMTRYLDPGLRASGDTASFVVAAAGSAVPEPLTWAMMVVGFATIGAGLRRNVSRGTSLASS